MHITWCSCHNKIKLAANCFLWQRAKCNNNISSNSHHQTFYWSRFIYIMVWSATNDVFFFMFLEKLTIFEPFQNLAGIFPARESLLRKSNRFFHSELRTETGYHCIVVESLLDTFSCWSKAIMFGVVLFLAEYSFLSKHPTCTDTQDSSYRWTSILQVSICHRYLVRLFVCLLSDLESFIIHKQTCGTFYQSFGWFLRLVPVISQVCFSV